MHKKLYAVVCGTCKEGIAITDDYWHAGKIQGEHIKDEGPGHFDQCRVYEAEFVEAPKKP